MNTKLCMVALVGLLFLGVGCTTGGSAPTGNAPGTSATTLQTQTRLDLSSSGLTSVPSYVFGMSKLEDLNLSNNNLTGALPAEIRQLQNLRVLNASGNQMTGVPAEIGQLSKLEDLNLSDNQLTGLPFELGNLSKLRVLDLRGNNASAQDLNAIRAKLTNTQILQ